jgi:uncharacterized protein (TIGR00369 family)
VTGLQQLQAMLAGDLPPAPIAELLGMTPVEIEPGRAVFECDPGPQHYNPIGVVHGGVAMTLLDSVMGCAVHATLAEGEAYTSLETKVNFVRALHAGDHVVAAGVVVHRGGRTATCEGRVERDGKLVAHGTSTCLILRGGG